MKRFTFLIFITILAFGACTNQEPADVKVTVVELGCLRCGACIKMMDVIDEINENYPTSVKTIFYNICTEEGKPYADVYKIGPIPTQIILDQNGEEILRHEGYFDFEEIKKVLDKYLISIEDSLAMRVKPK